MIYKLLSLIFLWGISVIIYAQEAQFTVLSTQGNIFLHDESDSDLKLESGQILFDYHKVTIKKESKFIFVDSLGVIWKVTEGGNYTIKNLRKTPKYKKVLPKKYQHLLGQELFSKKKKVSPTANRTTRASEDDAYGLLLPMSVQVLEPKLTLKLFNIQHDSLELQWNIKALTVAEEILFQDTVRGKKFEIDLQDYFEESENIIIHVKALDSHGKQLKTAVEHENMISKVDDHKAERLHYDLENILESITDQELRLLIKARFYEEYNLVADAITAYENLLELVPNSKAYSRAYEAFLIRVGLNL